MEIEISLLIPVSYNNVLGVDRNAMEYLFCDFPFLFFSALHRCNQAILMEIFLIFCLTISFIGFSGSFQ